MSARSGMEGFCKVCLHANNEHYTAPCPATGCLNRWKECTASNCLRERPKGSKASKGSKALPYRVCFGCKDHPACRENLDFSGDQVDVPEKQNEDYAATGTAGGQDAEGNWTR
ncbi:uncharacterized protein BO95DRAFT_68598 [Aspergillus brunneoviolaceus CBS 621.78]|uniref:Uncharacterized protein n=1 Tax=Aspergillus brunneoviolaceus CBS 621.78 TaxID=1450534 RepID=A0ACD1GFS9_9EURO|nr:hypothetical protein BO95DRAFT_68598 [Aspergillus brunneoviolaceus CBS 621.78]RAH48118.1 hypothetical protein BO95DRAFT_68598 [Aspergillus brunneoviolaceus CBS 621.78]